MRYCLYTNTNMKGHPTYVCEITMSHILDGREFIHYEPLDGGTFVSGQKYIDNENIKIISKEQNPEYFL